MRLDALNRLKRLFFLIFAAQNSAHSSLLIVVICVAFIALICGITIARIRNSSDGSRVNGESGRKRSGEKHQPVKVCCAKK